MFACTYTEVCKLTTALTHLTMCQVNFCAKNALSKLIAVPEDTRVEEKEKAMIDKYQDLA